jgi:hypothetical protein
MSEDDRQRDGGQLPRLPARKHDRESLERAGRPDWERWLPGVSLVVDLITTVWP